MLYCYLEIYFVHGDLLLHEAYKEIKLFQSNHKHNSIKQEYCSA